MSHLSAAMHDRFTTLAVWAQGIEYPRLALLLRRIADHIELLLERVAGADAYPLLDEITIAYAFVCALDDAAARNVAPRNLVGQARSRYEASSRMQLLGLGAHAWRAASGYLGLTMIFWSIEDETFYACTDARPEGQGRFDPRARYHASGPWSGLGAPAEATGRRVVLMGAQVSAAGRLSAAEGVRATIQRFDRPAEFTSALRPVADWATLRTSRDGVRRSLLAEHRPMNDWLVLEPARHGTPAFDGARQTMVWPLFDAAERKLDAELRYTPATEHAISRIEQMGAGGCPPGSLLVARIRDTPTGLVGEPLSIVKPDAAPEENPVDALYFDPPPQAVPGLGMVEEARACVDGRRTCRRRREWRCVAARAAKV